MTLVAPTRPRLTLPDDEAQLVSREYERAGVILEYGSGGSTVIASELPGKRIFSVESDPNWMADMQAWFNHAPGLSPVVLHHADIGPVREWGQPADDRAFRKWPSYPHSVWELPGFKQPDVVLIDGRFRAATFATVALRITRPTVVLFDDYTPRPGYHTVERLAKPVSFAGRMARFELEPQSLPGALAGWYAALFTVAK